MIGQAGHGFEPGEAMPAELPLKRGELIDPAAVEPMPVAARSETAKLSTDFTPEAWRTGVVDHGREDSAKAVVGADKMVQ